MPSSGSLGFMFTIWLKFFFLFTPFFALTMFLSTTKAHTESQRGKLAVQVTCAVTVLCISLFFFGKFVFSVFGITLDASSMVYFIGRRPRAAGAVRAD